MEQTESSMELSENVRRVMRRWATGVSVVTSRHGDLRHGMTVNSFTSISLDPPLVSVTLANDTRTFGLVTHSGVLGITFLREDQQEISDRFAGRMAEDEDRFAGLETFILLTGAPLLAGSLAYLDCRVVFTYPMPTSTLLIAEVVATRLSTGTRPLIYYNRSYPRLVE
ncbi:MAG TPA: flavin reductase family protein [Anaerolineaceae bacterium]|nr:flavin reductase family protein [Anaerolineaceae bacterium]